MRSHVLLVTDLIDPYLSPRCFTQNMVLSWGFLSALYHYGTGRHYRLDRIHGVECTTTIRPLLSSRTTRFPQVLDV